jgi:NADPH:quinone reductase-like Zn-dependent oxidoreductase
MRAISYSEFGDEHVMRYRTDVPDPVPGEGELLVRVKAAGVNPVDWKVTAGYAKGHLDIRMPVIPGWDVAGVVEALGPGAEGFAVGDGIFAYDRTPVVQQGTYAELTVVPASYAAPRPERGTWAQAGGLPLVGLTALKSLEAIGGVGPDDTVLIHAAAGGVGSTAVQIAKARGARVIGTASVHNHEFVRNLGAEPVGYGADLARNVREVAPDGVSAVADYVGGEEALDASFALVEDPARVVSTTMPQAASRGGKHVFIEPDAAALRELARLVDEGSLLCHVDRELALDEAAKAYRESMEGHIRGKIVLVP